MLGSEVLDPEALEAPLPVDDAVLFEAEPEALDAAPVAVEPELSDDVEEEDVAFFGSTTF